MTLGLTFVVAIGIFFLAPAGVGWLTEHFLHWNAWWSNLLEGIIRLFILNWIYLWESDLAGYCPRFCLSRRRT